MKININCVGLDRERRPERIQGDCVVCGVHVDVEYSPFLSTTRISCKKCRDEYDARFTEIFIKEVSKPGNEHLAKAMGIKTDED